MSRHIERNGTLDKWIDGLATLDQPDDVDEAMWAQVTEAFFGRTQEAVHVISGRLKASGRQSTHRQGDRIIGEVSYGGPDAPYAIYEFRRGGTHDALRRGYETMTGLYQRQFAEIVERKVGRWA